jgi:uncharacterized protein YndB with AHSA1/START domain
MKNVIQHNWFFEQAPETVWEYLTRSELMAQWLMENDFQPVVGHQFMFRSKAYPPIGFDGNVFCQVLDLVPAKKLSYSWKFGPKPGEITVDSIVTWNLISKDRGTELRLEHRSVSGEMYLPAYNAMNEGWKKNIEVNMKKIMEESLSHETKH